MKIWYQSVTRNGRFPAYNDVLRRVIDRAKDPDTEVEIQGIERQGGTGDQYRYLAFLQTVEVLENVHRAIEEGFDAFLIGNIGNPGLLEAREIAEFPILGLGETSINVMRTMGEHFGLVTINEKYQPRLDDVIRHADAERRLTGMYPMDFPQIFDLETACRDISKRDEVFHCFKSAGEAASRDGAEIILAAGGVVVALLADSGIDQLDDGTPVLNGIAALIKQGEAAVRLSRQMSGSYTSKRLSHAKPPPHEIAGYREDYNANVYPTVSEGEET